LKEKAPAIKSDSWGRQPAASLPTFWKAGLQ
jgi:hypothetical protein